MTLYKRKDSPFYWVKFPPIKGELRPLMQSTGTANKRDAKRYHDKLQGERWRVERIGVKPERTWDEAVAKYEEETAGHRSFQRQASMLRWLGAHLNGKSLSAINRELLDEVRAKRAKCSAPGTVNRYMALVRSILRRACLDWEWIDRVPKVGMVRDKAGRVRALTREEYVALMAELPEHLRDMAQFSIATGLRQSNVVRLQWRQVSIERRHLWVSADHHKNGRAHSVPLNETAMQVLLRRQGDHPVYVFTYEGRPVVQVNTKAWRSALKRAGIEGFRWHDLRHTFATWQREAGTPIWELQRLGGWKTPSMVERYAHVAPEGLQLAASRLDAALAAPSS